MKKIVCFGDSNTWGYNPDNGGRYPKSVRWTGRLAEILKNEAEIIEEGQNGRTIANSDPWEWGTKSGMEYVLPMMETHKPIDLLIIMLGSNDMKRRFNLSACDIAGSLKNMLLQVKAHSEYHLGCPDMKILVVAPPLIGDKIAESVFAPFFDVENVVQTSKELAKWYEIAANEFGCEFFNAGAYVSGSDSDSLHLNPLAHKYLADELAGKVREMIR